MSDIRRQKLLERNTTHGLSRDEARTYRSWKDMRRRINCPRSQDFANYGGRGIKVCDRWSDFAAFFADMGRRPAGMTLDRIDVNGDYEPRNCRWADAQTQASNKRTNRLLSMGGLTKTVTEWARHLGVDRTKLQYRLKIGLTLAEAATGNDLRRNANLSA